MTVWLSPSMVMSPITARLAKAAVLQDVDGSRELVAPKTAGQVADHAANRHQGPARQRSLVVHLAGGLDGPAVLTVARLLLCGMVRNKEACSVRPGVDGEPAARSPTSLPNRTLPPSRTRLVVEILEGRRIQVAVRASSQKSDGHLRPAPGVLVRECAEPRSVAASQHVHRGAVAQRGVPPRVEGDHPGKPPAVLGRNSGDENRDRLELTGVECRGKADRPVVVQRHSVDDVLRVVLRAARVKDRVGLDQPARHGRDDIDNAAAQGRAQRAVESLPAGTRSLRGPERLEKGHGRTNRDRRIDGCDGHGDPNRLRNGGNAPRRVRSAGANPEWLATSR